MHSKKHKRKKQNTRHFKTETERLWDVTLCPGRNNNLLLPDIWQWQKSLPTIWKKTDFKRLNLLFCKCVVSTWRWKKLISYYCFAIICFKFFSQCLFLLIFTASGFSFIVVNKEAKLFLPVPVTVKSVKFVVKSNSKYVFQVSGVKVKLAWAICFEWKAVSPLKWVQFSRLHLEGFVSVGVDFLIAGMTGTTTQLSVSGHNLLQSASVCTVKHWGW